MDQQGHGQAQVSQVPYGGTFQPSQVTGATVVPPWGPQMTQHQLAYQQQMHHHQHQHQQEQLQEQLQVFWQNQFQDIEKVTDFKNHSLPLARIKKIMKADEDVRMISAEAPVVFARACEMFILELTLRAWNHTEENKRRTLQKNDIAAAITRTDIFDFLVDIVPREDLKDEILASIPRGGPVGMPMAGPTDAVPYYYMPPGQNPPAHAGDPPGMVMMGNPNAYVPQSTQAYMGQAMWPQQPPPQQQQSSSDT